MEVFKIAQRIQSLSTEERQYLLEEILSDESVSVTELIIAKVYKLEKFKRNAIRDIAKVADAGIELGEKEMRRVTKIKGKTRKKTDDFYLSMIRCLLDAGAYKGTEYANQIESSDFSSIDKEWYEKFWKPYTYAKPTNEKESPK